MWRGPHSLLKTIIEGYFYCYLSKHETQAMYRLIINKLLFSDSFAYTLAFFSRNPFKYTLAISPRRYSSYTT